MRKTVRSVIVPAACAAVLLAGCGSGNSATVKSAAGSGASAASSAASSATSSSAPSPSSSDSSPSSSASDSSSSSASGTAGSSTPDQKAVMATAEDFLHAMGDKDANKVCSLMTVLNGDKPLTGTSEMPECVASMKSATAKFTSAQGAVLKAAKVKSATVNGDHASVAGTDVVGSSGSSMSKLPFVKLDGKWYVDSPNFNG